MELSSSDLQSLVARVERLERQNRLLKRIGLTLFLSGAAFVVMGQARPSRTVEAERFVLKDTGGRMRGLLAAGDENNGPGLLLYDSNGEIQVAITVKLQSGPDFTLFNPVDKAYFKVSSGKVELGVPHKSYMQLNALPGPSALDALHLLLRDEAGYSAILGSVELNAGQAGERHTTSAASLKLFDKNNNVIWSAP
jgi:hypothetical protein